MSLPLSRSRCRHDAQCIRLRGGNPIDLTGPSGLLYTSTDSGSSSAGDLDPYQQVHATLAAVVMQEKTLQNNHHLSAADRSAVVGSIEGLMNQAYTEQGAISDRCSHAYAQLQAATGDAAST